MMEQDKQIVVLIPAYKPEEGMLVLCKQLRDAGLEVLVVDDGGGAPFAARFEAVMAMGCHVEHHAVNLGKGRALKTGINAAINRYGDRLAGVVTADADGQHTCVDILRVMDAMREHPTALVTGARAFTGNVPFKSRAGNAITRHVYRFVTGIRCQDTQTGLRGIPAFSLGEMLRMPGERYEYEMTMLLRLRDLDMPLVEVPIETIYINGNEGSHFSPLRDATRIYAVILRFMLSSVLSFLLDYALYLLALGWLALAPGLGYALARAVSSLFNYWLNRKAVFGGRGGAFSVVRYYILAVCLLVVGAALVDLLARLGWSAAWVKIPVDILLFFVSYVFQRDFVFGNRWQRKK